MSPRALVRPAVALVVALSLLSGCSNDEPTAASAASRPQEKQSTPVPGPSDEPTPTSSTRTYAPPDKAPEPVPATTADKTTAGIFVLVWFETLNYSFASGDADPLRRSVGLGCFTCANWITEVQTRSNRKQTQSGGSIHVRDLAYAGPVADDFLFRAVLDRDPGTVANRHGVATPISSGSGEIVEIRVGVSTSPLSGRTAWTVKSLTPPSG